MTDTANAAARNITMSYSTPWHPVTITLQATPDSMNPDRQGIPADQEYYWQRLAAQGLLSWRLCDVLDPDYMDVLRMLSNPMSATFYVSLRVPPEHPAHPGHNGIAAEFTLEHQTGRAWQLHFSMSPDNPTHPYKFNIPLARATMHAVFNSWTPDLRPATLYGLTPMSNRRAIAFLKKVGFREIGILPKGIKACYKEKTDPSYPYDDALITILTRGDTHGWWQGTNS